MALRILLADDSLTAQNMGKKILADAGYEVTAVSNGAAAVKKIAELKPDLVVLDVYMPGYTGLEVCERVKAAQETSTTPVLLTVGKMEPFKPEDGNRVRADGVVVKPFEATDLLAAVEKIASKLMPSTVALEPAEYERTIKMTVSPEEDASYAEWHATAEAHVEVEEAPKEEFKVPDEMAAAPAVGMDLLEPVPSAPQPERSTVALEEPAAMAAAAEAAAPVIETFEAPVPMSEAPTMELAPKEPAPLEVPPIEMSAAPIELPEAAPLEVAPIEIPMEAAPLEAELLELPHPGAEKFAAVEAPPELETFGPSEPVVAAPPPAELEPTGAAAVGEVAPARPEGFETTAAPPHLEPIPATDSLLVTDASSMAQEFPTRFGVEGADIVPVGVASEMTGLYADEHAPAAEEASILEEAASAEVPHPPTEEIPVPVPTPAPSWQAHEERPDTQEVAVSLEEEMAAAAPAPAPSSEALAEEMQRAFADLPVEHAPVEEPVLAPEHEMAAAMAAAAGASAGAAVTQSFADSTQKLDSVQIAQIADIVNRVTERLKTEMMAEIVRELENFKR